MTGSGVSISSIYQQYKADTAQIANWLGQAANNCGYSNKSIFKRSAGNDEQNREGGAEHGRTTKQLRNARKKANARAKARTEGELGGEGCVAPTGACSSQSGSNQLVVSRKHTNYTIPS